MSKPDYPPVPKPRRKPKPLKLFVWHEFSPDYSDGLAFALARTEEQARELIVKEWGYSPSTWGEVTVYAANKPIGFGRSGGS